MIENNSKVTSISKKIQESNDNQELDSQLKTKLSDIGVRLNATLKKIIISKTQQQINNALSAVEEYLASDKKVKSKAGLVRTALEENWTPNLSDEKKQLSQVNDTFSEWFNPLLSLSEIDPYSEGITAISRFQLLLLQKNRAILLSTKVIEFRKD